MGETLTGIVTNVNDGGVQIDSQMGWLNFSQPQYRGTPWHDPAVGDNVSLQMVTAKNQKDYVKTIELLEQAAPVAVAPAPRSRQFSSDSVALSPRYLALKLATERFTFDATTDLAGLSVQVGKSLAVADDYLAYLTQQDGEA